MDFHQSASERFAEKLFEFVIKEFDGKIINSDDCNLELLMKKLPRDLDEDIELIDHIQNNNIVENDSISSILLKNFNYSYNHLSKVFKSSENISIEKYFLKLKIEKIKEYLSYDELSIKEISYKLNYNSVSHLSNHFKKVTGFSPSTYKKNKFKRSGLNIND